MISQKAKYVLDADMAKCFDRIDHEALLNKLNTFPTIRRQIRAWLKAGVMDAKQLFPTSEGTPQGGVISPLLANIALHGMENWITQAFPTKKVYKNGKYAGLFTAPNFVRSTVASNDAYEGQDHLMFQKLKAWAKRRHPQKAIQWMIKRYWKTIGGNNWVFATSAGGENLTG
ncbi:MAG TPA: reverse transcriptase domain-containing protein [Allocoleopsis sp.]